MSHPRTLIVKILTLQCTIVKGSLFSLFMLVLALPLFLIMTPMAWIANRIEQSGRLKFLTTPIRLPGIIKEADEACDLNIKKYENFLWMDREP